MNCSFKTPNRRISYLYLTYTYEISKAHFRKPYKFYLRFYFGGDANIFPDIYYLTGCTFFLDIIGLMLLHDTTHIVRDPVKI